MLIMRLHPLVHSMILAGIHLNGPLSEAGQRSFYYGGAMFWNSLPTQAKTTLKSFKE